ncbi:MAG TPA: EpsI family protein [Vicinamibacterales bacterium]|nr:EpsI family protein [Vicinamibacterales bacterium]
MVARVLIVTALLLGTGVAAQRAGSIEASIQREPLAALPVHVGEWQGRDAPPLADDVVSELGVDDYVNRLYAAPGGLPIGLYVGYYLSQRRGDTIHSPRNCLPGAGWRPVSSDLLDLSGPSSTVRVNRYVIQKGLDRQVVLYWYEGRGRVVANDYANKLLLMWDAARHNRTSGGLVRVITPVIGSEIEATDRAARFATLLLPRLEAHLP